MCKKCQHIRERYPKSMLMRNTRFVKEANIDSFALPDFCIIDIIQDSFQLVQIQTIHNSRRPVILPRRLFADLDDIWDFVFYWMDSDFKHAAEFLGTVDYQLCFIIIIILEAYWKKSSKLRPLQIPRLRIWELCPNLLEASHLLSWNRSSSTARRLENIREVLHHHTYMHIWVVRAQTRGREKNNRTGKHIGKNILKTRLCQT